MALYRCDWRWSDPLARRPPDERDRAFARVFTAAERDASPGDRIRGWYTYPGSVAGFLIVEAESHQQLAQMLRAYTELMDFAITPIVPLDYQQTKQHLIGA